MLYWKSFSDQAEIDLQRAKNLFESQDFGFSAYCAQQALEKYIKSYFYRSGLIENNNARSFGHMPLGRMLSDIKHELNGVEKRQRSDKLFSTMLKSIMISYAPIRSIFDEMKDDEQKILWWKYSLKIPTTTKIFDEKADTMLKSLTKFYADFDSYNENQFNPNLDKINKVFSKTDVERILALRDEMKDMTEAAMHQNIDKMMQNEPFNENASSLLKLFSILQKSDNSTGKFIHGDMKRLMAYTKILTHVRTIMKSFPHEDIGRYPTEIDEKDSTLLYEENKDNLLILINEISETCDKIKLYINE